MTGLFIHGGKKPENSFSGHVNGEMGVVNSGPTSVSSSSLSDPGK